MTLQKTGTKSTGALTSLEREALATLVKEYNSNFRVKAGRVTNVSLETATIGRIVLNDADGKMYMADATGWVAM